MIDSDGSRDINNDNKSPNRLSQLFIFGPGHPRFSYTLGLFFSFFQCKAKPRLTPVITLYQVITGRWTSLSLAIIPLAILLVRSFTLKKPVKNSRSAELHALLIGSPAEVVEHKMLHCAVQIVECPCDIKCGTRYDKNLI